MCNLKNFLVDKLWPPFPESIDNHQVSWFRVKYFELIENSFRALDSESNLDGYWCWPSRVSSHKFFSSSQTFSSIFIFLSRSLLYFLISDSSTLQFYRHFWKIGSRLVSFFFPRLPSPYSFFFYLSCCCWLHFSSGLSSV